MANTIIAWNHMRIEKKKSNSQEKYLV
jgi:hypothetical protein